MAARDEGPRALPSPGHLRGDRGVVIPLVAICLPLLIISVGLAIDLGVTVVTARDARRFADLSALDAARVIDGRTTAELDPLAAAAALASAERNDFDSLTSSLEVVLGTAGSGGLAGFSPTGPAEVPDAVRVTASVPSDHAFSPGSTTITRAAVAVPGSDSIAAVRVSSAPPAVDATQAQVLDALVAGALGGPASLTQAEWQQIADAQLTLAMVATELGLAPDDLAGLLGVSRPLDDLLAAMAAALAATPAGPPLDSLVPSAAPEALVLSDVLDVDPQGADPMADLPFGALELVAAMAAGSLAGSNFTTTLSPTTAGVAALVAEVEIGDGPLLVVGPAGNAAAAAPVTVVVRVTTDPLPGLDAVTAPIVLTTGASGGTIIGVACDAEHDPASISVGATAAAGESALGERSGSSTTDAELMVLDGGDIVVLGHATATASTATATLTFAAPLDGAAQSVGSPIAPGTVLSLDTGDLTLVTTGSPSVPPNLLDDVAASLVSTVVPQVDAVGPGVLRALGASLGDADVTAPWGACTTGAPRLVA